MLFFTAGLALLVLAVAAVLMVIITDRLATRLDRPTTRRPSRQRTRVLSKLAAIDRESADDHRPLNSRLVIA